jgi:site-specific DNA-methyltransferase (adenine-specific)
MATIRLLKGDCLQKLKELEDNSIDSVVTDPPYGIGFMNKEWDSPKKHKELIEREQKRSEERHKEGKSPAKGTFTKGVQPGLPIGGAKEGRWFQEWSEEWAKEAYRVLKPGGYILSFCAPRMYHRMTSGIEDAGFEIRDQLMWVFGSGFPKSMNIGHKVDEYQGWGTALKPAHEPIVMGRKPFKGTVADNVLEWGTGGINVDGCRVEMTDSDKEESYRKPIDNIREGFVKTPKPEYKPEGRFPANIIFDEEAGKILDEQSGNKTGQRGVVKGTEPSHSKKNAIYGDYSMVEGKFAQPIDGLGGASRFFYCPKASKKDRNDGCNGLPIKRPDTRTDTGMGSFTEKGVQPQSNHHPTVKPTDLMAYLIRLVTPKGGVVLDPFMGSGSTGKAAVREGMNFIGIEREEEYMEIAKTRIEHEQKKNKHTHFFDI